MKLIQKTLKSIAVACIALFYGAESTHGMLRNIQKPTSTYGWNPSAPGNFGSYMPSKSIVNLPNSNQNDSYEDWDFSDITGKGTKKAIATPVSSTPVSSSQTADDQQETPGLNEEESNEISDINEKQQETLHNKQQKDLEAWDKEHKYHKGSIPAFDSPERKNFRNKQEEEQNKLDQKQAANINKFLQVKAQQQKAVADLEKKQQKDLEAWDKEHKYHKGSIPAFDSPERKVFKKQQEKNLESLKQQHQQNRLKMLKTGNFSAPTQGNIVQDSKPTTSSTGAVQKTGSMLSKTLGTSPVTTSIVGYGFPNYKTPTSKASKSLQSKEKGYGTRLVDWAMSKIGFGTLGRAEKVAKKVALDREANPGPELENVLAPLSKEQREHILNRWLKAWEDQEDDKDFKVSEMQKSVASMIFYMNQILPKGENLVLVTRETPKRDTTTRKPIIDIQALQFEVADSAELRQIKSNAKYQFGTVDVYDQELSFDRMATQTFDKEAPAVIKQQGISTALDVKQALTSKQPVRRSKPDNTSINLAPARSSKAIPMLEEVGYDEELLETALQNDNYNY